MHATVNADREALRLVRNLQQARAAIYWTDLAVSTILGWVAFGVALFAQPFSARMCLAIAIAAFALYRSLCFVHEISHFQKRGLPGFATVWNLVVGISLLLPEFVYVGVHPNHHNLATYGTDQDPEYLPFANSHRRSVVFLLHSVLLPSAFLIRFLLLAPVALLWPRFHHWLVTYASSLSMNPAYRRQDSPALTARIRRGEGVILLIWVTALAVAWRYGLAWKALAVWYAVNAFISVCNTLRTLGAHRYKSTGVPLDRSGQLRDSIDTPGAVWTELWAPVGLRYHALHHYFPGIPYHNLALAHQRLTSTLPEAAEYHETQSPSLPESLRTLYVTGKAAFRRKPNAEVYPQASAGSGRIGS